MRNRVRKVAVLALAAIALQPAGCSDPTGPVTLPEGASQIVSQVNKEFPLRISFPSGNDNITAVEIEPEELAEVKNINGIDTTIRCSSAGRGKVVIKWNNRAPNADPQGQMIRETSRFELYCAHAQGAGN